MKTGIFAIGCLLTIIFCLSCREVYYPDEILAGERIPVVIGSIMEGQAPKVQLRWAFTYDQGQTTAYMDGAQVWITDDLGGLEQMEETGNGNYAAVNGDFQGVMGRTYTLHVETPEGDLFESTAEQILPVVTLDSMYAAYVDREVYVRTSTGNLFLKPQEGLDVFVSLSKVSDSTCFYRFLTNVLEEVIYISLVLDEGNPDTVIIDTTYGWESYKMGDFYDARFSYRDQAKQVVPEQNLGYLDYSFNPWLATETLSAPMTYGWVVSTHVVSISANMYRYYSSVAEQLGAGDRIFAPVPSQIRTNLQCVNNLSQPVLGMFEASSETVFHQAYRWLGDGEFLRSDLEDFPQDLGDGSIEGEPPDFWIEF